MEDERIESEGGARESQRQRGREECREIKLE